MKPGILDQNTMTTSLVDLLFMLDGKLIHIKLAMTTVLEESTLVQTPMVHLLILVVTCGQLRMRHISTQHLHFNTIQETLLHLYLMLNITINISPELVIHSLVGDLV